MATTLEEVGQAQMPPLAEGLQEGSTCPCCNTTTCTSVEWGRTMALKVRRAQADQLQQTAVMLKQAFQTVRPGLIQVLWFVWRFWSSAIDTCRMHET